MEAKMPAELTESDVLRLRTALAKIGLTIAQVPPEQLVAHIEGSVNALVMARQSGLPFLEYSERRY
jgi:hypothetical protein